MPELRLQVDDSTLAAINESLKDINGASKSPGLSANDVGREALAVYKWVLEQTKAGKAVVSADKNLSQLTQIATPNLPAKSPSI